MKLIVNIPAFNEAKVIGTTIQRIRESFNNSFYQTGIGNAIHEKLIQVIDDGSTDSTASVARASGAHLIVSYKPNRRLAYSFKRAVENALEQGADLMVNIDADGQFDPQDIPKLLTPILEGKRDMVIANRFGGIEAKNIPLIRKTINKFAASIIGKFLNTDIGDLTCGFRAHGREALLKLNLANTTFTYTQETIIDAIGKSLKLEWVPIEVHYFDDREPKITKSLWKFVSNGFKIIVKAVRDVRPMKFFGIPGFLLIGISFVLFLFFAVLYFQDFKITPYRNYLFFAGLSFIVGLQFVVFALLADMVKSNRLLIEEQLYLMKKSLYEKRESESSS